MIDLLSQVKSAKQPKPRRILLYGVEGIGKSTWGAGAPNPVFISTEDGISNIDVPAFPQAEKYSDVMQATYELATRDHDFQTLVLDSADWFEKFIVTQICQTAGAKSINDPHNKEVSFGNGQLLAIALWDKWLEYVGLCRDKGMNIILIAHCHTPTFKDPSSESYNRFEPKLHKTINERLREWADEVFFATYETYVTKHEEGFSRERTQAIGTGRRILRCSEMPSHKAKNRLKLPAEIDFDSRVYWEYVKGSNSGIVASE